MVLIACSTRKPLIMSRTSFAFCGLVRWNLASARNSRIAAADFAIIFLLTRKLIFQKPVLRLRLGRGLARTCRVTLECARRRELAQLVSDHVLRHIHRDELA